MEQCYRVELERVIFIAVRVLASSKEEAEEFAIAKANELDLWDGADYNPPPNETKCTEVSLTAEEDGYEDQDCARWHRHDWESGKSWAELDNEVD